MASKECRLLNSNGTEEIRSDSMGDFVFDIFSYISEHKEYADKLGKYIKSSKDNRFGLDYNSKLNDLFVCIPEGMTIDDYVKNIVKERKRWSDSTISLRMGNLGEKEVYVWKGWNSDDIETRPQIRDLNHFMNKKCGFNWRFIVDGKDMSVEVNEESVVSQGLDIVISDSSENSNNLKLPMQKIYYGAPGTGKSYGIKENVGVDGNGKMRTDNNIRVTFHPDSDYASFVGCYKPMVDDNDQIVYKFVPQAFVKAYVKAWKKYLELQEAKNNHKELDLKEYQFYLVIEEINRGNCAQIFGDIFQLLDRNDKGFSEYGINVDTDLEKYLKDEFRNDDFSGVSDGDNIRLGKKMYLPSTLSLLATMNTSDQSLFPMDGAFKRRWDWKYVPITKGDEVYIGDSGYTWGNFLDKINTKIEETTGSTDKQMGYYFVKPDLENNTISIELFVDKVMFYLWNDVFKRYGKNEENKEYNIVKFYKKDGVFDLSKVNEVLRKLLRESESKGTENATE